jgi:hypothetical protein
VHIPPAPAQAARGSGVMGRRQRAAELRDVMRVQACTSCGRQFAGDGARVQHLDGQRCLPEHVFESVLTEAGGIWYALGTEPAPRRR